MNDAIDAFLATARRIVYATLATVDRHGRPRSRIVHPVWELEGERLVGWVGTRPTALKREGLAASGFASCLYWDPTHDVAVAECAAAWVPADEHATAWERLAAAPAPMGYDPSAIWSDGPRGDGFAAIRLDPWRMQTRSATATAAGEPYTVWKDGERGRRLAGTGRDLAHTPAGDCGCR
jgi:hypothetical protein